MPEILYENYTRSYYAPLYSMSGCICVSVVIVVFTLPFFSSFYNGYFWSKSYTYYEAPIINFNNEYIITVLEDGISKFYSSYPSMNVLYPNTLTSPILQVTPIDSNMDSVIDKYHILFKFSSDPSKIQNIRLMLFWDYYLKEKIILKTQTMTYIDLDFSYPASYIITTGSIKLQQKSPISKRTILDATLSDGIFKNSTLPSDVNFIYQYFNKLNITTYYDYQKIVMPYMSTTDTTLDMTFNIPSYQQVTGQSTIAMIIKDAWPKYFCLFIPTALFAFFIMNFLFKYRILETVIYDDLPEEMMERKIN